MKPFLLLGLCSLLLAGCTTNRVVLPSELPERLRSAVLEVMVNGHLEGTGWLASEDGLAFTASHAVPAATQRVEVVLGGGERLPARVVAVDRGHDIALLALPPRATPYPFLEIRSEIPALGEPLFLLGTPVYRHGILLAGWLARPTPGYEFTPIFGDHVRALYIQATASPGTSGGAWVDGRGRVVACQSGLIRLPDLTAGLSYGAPGEAAARLLLTRTNAATPTLGCVFEELSEQPQDYIRRFPAGSEGLRPVQIRKNSPAAAAGLTGDQLVVQIDGQEVRLRDQIAAQLRTHKPGDEVRLTVKSSGSAESKTITVRPISLE